MTHNKSLKAAHIRSLDSFSLGMLRILCPALRCPLALRYVLRMEMRQLIIYIFVSFIMLSSEAIACSCMSFSHAYRFSVSDNVAFGTVSNIRPSKENGELEGDFEVKELFKGNRDKIKKIIGSERSSPSCSLKLMEGNYLIYSNNQEEIYITQCGYSSYVKKEHEDKLLNYIRGLRNNPSAGKPTGLLHEYLEEVCKIDQDYSKDMCLKMKSEEVKHNKSLKVAP